ncbi:hypothetical protein PHMEG_0009586 [Phytophthora megakarya]|uniref:Reverse transcriptase n=1 Tax=Phytophthora megakarya TaxID=4795 RepID=A0A225WGF6_9STRA|nr:hypothetical protein PHMEG_0009586 [Phytophthora megakarya]
MRVVTQRRMTTDLTRTYPFGVFDKGGEDASVSSRTIHDLSYPKGDFINDYTDPTSNLKPEYHHCDAVASEILHAKREHPEVEVEIMTGDVASAFRNISIHSNSAYLVAGWIEEKNGIIIALSVPFGWTGSPGFYEIVGGAVSHVHGCHYNDANPIGFFNYYWVDDHINVAANVGRILNDLDRSLRFAMGAILGAGGINDENFTPWATRQRVLGLEFDSTAELVRMPQTKIDKARRILVAVYAVTVLSCKAYRPLLDSLRQLATCIRAARSFLRRLRIRERHLHRFESDTVFDEMKQDLFWWWQVLHRPQLNGVSITIKRRLYGIFQPTTTPRHHIEVDASDFGLCALDITAEHALMYRYTPTEIGLITDCKGDAPNSFDINYRELLSCAFAVHAWGPRWVSDSHDNRRPRHVHFRVDNMSAVACWWETTYRIWFSASHVAGVDNVRADADSRLSANQSHATLFSSLTSGWTQYPATVDVQGLTDIWRHISELTPLPIPRTTNLNDH